MKDARKPNGGKAVKPRPPVPRIEYSAEITEEHFESVKRAHRDLNGPTAQHGGLGGAPLFPGD